MISEQEQSLIERYQQQLLSDEDKVLFIKKIMENDGYNEFANTLKLRIQVEYALKKNPVSEVSFSSEGKHTSSNITNAEKKIIGSYTLEEILQVFAPIEELEKAANTRSSATIPPKNLQFIAVLPENGIDCSDLLSFDLGEVVNSDLQCSIYNNKREKVLSKEIPANSVSFDVELSLPIGRYYWQLTPINREVRQQLGLAVGMFFVHKELMPEQ